MLKRLLTTSKYGARVHVRCNGYRVYLFLVINSEHLIAYTLVRYIFLMIV